MKVLVSLVFAVSVSFGSAELESWGCESPDQASFKEIADAITLGQHDEVAPYTLSSIFPRAKDPAAVVYTPYIRIARKVRQAVAAGQRYGPSDVDAETAAALVHVVMSADALAPIEGLTANDPIAMAVVKAPDQRLLHSGRADMARTVVEQRERVEPKLPRSQHRGVIVGAFERAQLCAGCYVVGFRMRQEPNGHREILSVWARITPDDVRSWR